MLVEFFLQPQTDRLQRRSGAEDLTDTLFFQGACIGVGDDPAAEDEDVTEVALAQFFHDTGEEGEVRTGEQRQADGIDVFLQCRLGDLLGGLVQARVDDLETMVTKCTGDGFGATVMAIQARLGDDNSVGPLHKEETLRRSDYCATTRHNGVVPTPRLRSPLARAVAPVAAGIVFFGLLFLALWGAAALISRNPERITNLGDRIFRVGSVDYASDTVKESGPVLYPDLRDPDGTRSIVLDHQGDDPATGWRVFYAYPADRDESCIAEQVEGTSTFTDCEGRTLKVDELAAPTDVRPLVENRETLYIDLRAGE